MLLTTGVKSPKPKFWGCEQAFSSQTRKILKRYRNHCIIPTKFCTTIKVTKGSSWVVQIRVQQIYRMADGHHIGKIENFDMHGTSIAALCCQLCSTKRDKRTVVCLQHSSVRRARSSATERYLSACEFRPRLVLLGVLFVCVHCDANLRVSICSHVCRRRKQKKNVLDSAWTILRLLIHNVICMSSAAAPRDVTDNKTRLQRRLNYY